jgi:hypothetical protein
MVAFPAVVDGAILFLPSGAGETADFGTAPSGPITTLTLDEQTKVSSYDSGRFSTVVGICERPYSARFMAVLAKVLCPGGKLVLQMPKAAKGTKALMFGGFADIVATSVSETHEQVCGANPDWDEGASAPVKLDVGGADAWDLAAVDDAATDLTNEDDLLAMDGMDTSLIKEALAECGPKSVGKKACKDCSCGYADELNTNDAAAAPPKSSCGSCGLGDAFRCSGCPYLGTPAFKAGDAVKLSL